MAHEQDLLMSQMEDWLTTAEAARLSGLSRQRIDQLSRLGPLDAVRVGDRRYISRRSLELWASGRPHRVRWRPRSLRELRFKRAEILLLAGRHHLRDVRVFGSVARDEADDVSDVDLLVGRAKPATAADVAEFAADLEDSLGCRVDVIVDDGGAAVSRIAHDAVAL